MKPLLRLTTDINAVGGRVIDADWDGLAAMLPDAASGLRIIASWGGGWDHVSVSLPSRTPTWDEMSTVHRLFFMPDESAMQLHVPERDHVNRAPTCLHLWRPQRQTIPLPPKEFV